MSQCVKVVRGLLITVIKRPIMTLLLFPANIFKNPYKYKLSIDEMILVISPIKDSVLVRKDSC